MLTGGMPFRAENVSKLKKCILEGTYLIPPYISEEAASLIRAILIGGFPSYGECGALLIIELQHCNSICNIIFNNCNNCNNCNNISLTRVSLREPREAYLYCGYEDAPLDGWDTVPRFPAHVHPPAPTLRSHRWGRCRGSEASRPTRWAGITFRGINILLLITFKGISILLLKE